MKHFISELFLTTRFFIVLNSLAVFWVLLYLLDLPSFPGKVGFAVFLSVLLLEYWVLFRQQNPLIYSRSIPAKLSNGDDNTIQMVVENQSARTVRLEIIDELPFQFQKRDFAISLTLQAGEIKVINYTLRPFERGEYLFGSTRFFIAGPLMLLRRRITGNEAQLVKVFPSFLHLRKYELMSVNDKVFTYGIKKIRRLGHSMEFEQINEYVIGDDLRTVNWMATARRNKLMVNHYTDEISQQIYSVIDTGRAMKMPFEGMRLLDYAVNASLMISDIAMLKHDKAGLVLIRERNSQLIAAERGKKHLQILLETLYNVETNFGETDYEAFASYFLSKVKQRSLIMLYTNFETLNSLLRQIGFLSRLARYHLVVIVFFENTEVNKSLYNKIERVEDVFLKHTILRFNSQKKRIVKELDSHGIFSVLTSPAALNISVLNKYIELKKRGMI